jgi:hypothetical protein
MICLEKNINPSDQEVYIFQATMPSYNKEGIVVIFLSSHVKIQ